MKTKQSIRILSLLLLALLSGASSAWAYYTTWNYSTTAKDNGRGSDGGNYTFRYDSKDTKDKFMDFRTYQMFNISDHHFKWNWDIRVNYGTVDNGNTTNIDVTIEYADGSKYEIARADFVGYQSPTVTKSTRPVYFSSIASNGTYKYMFTLEYQPTADDLERGVKRIYICGVTKWNKGKNVRNFQYERDISISSYTNMTPNYSCFLDNEGNYHFKVTGTPVVDDIQIGSITNIRSLYRRKYFRGKVTYGYSSYSDSWVDFNLTKDTRTGGTESDAEFEFTYPVKSFTVPLRLSQLNYFIDVNRETIGYSGTDHYAYTRRTSTGNDYHEGILFMPYTRVKEITIEFDKWKKKNLVQWTRNEQVYDYVNNKKITLNCQTDGTWYVLRYEKGQNPMSYEVIKEINGNSTNLKAEDNDIAYDKEYVYRVVFLPRFLKEKYADQLVSLPGESANHTKYDLWEEKTIKTTMEVPIKIAQDRSDDTGIHLTWNYNVQTKGCEWRIDKHPIGQSTWTTVTTLPVDTKQSSASYVEEGGSVCDLYVYRIMTTINDKELFSDTLVCNLPAGAYISDVKATTGSEDKFVTVKWKVERPGDDDIWFRILRRPIGSTEWTLLNDEIHGHSSEYTYNDQNVMIGSYYEYSIQAYGSKCEGQLVQTDSKIAPGFSQARGTITGHIAYGTGTAVAGARINLVKSSADEYTDRPQFLSRYIDGEGEGLQWTADSALYTKTLNGQKALSLQLWVKPSNTSDQSGGTILRLANALDLGVKSDDGSNFYLWAVDKTNGGTTPTYFPTLTFHPFDFTHVAATYSQGTWTFYVGNDTLLTATMNVATTNWNACSQTQNSKLPTLSIGGSITDNSLPQSGEIGGATFTGYVDDIRLWNRALSQKEITTNYTRILGGTDDGLILYWPLDEGINVKDYAFDVAYQDGLYQMNHPVVGVNALPSATTPQNLGLYGLTDAEGDYIIRGIPFQQGGTNYKLVPELGTHEFSPNTRSMFVSPTSLTANNIDFEDVSSFPMSGYIYYVGTNITTEGVMFYVDGELLTGNGQVRQTDSNGYYEISVPIGQHYVEARLDGHTMVDGGRFPTTGTYNFDRPVQYDFADSTLVNFVGRIGGGERNDTLAVGFGASKNNIGMATITLRLNNESFSFNCQDDHISDATTPRTWDSDTTSIASRSWTGTDYDAKYIFIRTDSLTGEFSALLPPLKYSTKSVTIDSNPNIEFISLPEIDLTNVRKELKDSLYFATENADSTWHFYAYNTKMVRSHFAAPQLTVNERGNAPGAYGIQQLENYEIDYGLGSEFVTINDIWKVEADGSIKYLLDYPVYEQDDKYTYELFAFEAYVNNDGSTPVTDVIPLNGQTVTITNEMANDQPIVYEVTDPSTGYRVGDVYEPTEKTFELGDDGKGYYRWQAGLPNITPPYTRALTITMERNQRTYALTNLSTVVLGHLSSGSNFVTKGPDIVNFVLRDPPGAKSKTTLSRASYSMTQKVTTDRAYGDEKWCTNWLGGMHLEKGVGVGVMIVTSEQAKVDITTGAHFTFEKGSKDESHTNFTTTESFSTSTGIPYVGSAGDLFVGTSTNLLIGEVRNLCITKTAADSPYTFAVVDAYSLGSEISTGFKFTQYEIETVMIPKWEDQRNRFLTEMDSVSAVNYRNNSNRSVYLTWLSPDDTNYGKKSYRYVPPADITALGKNEVDSVDWCNRQIDGWIKILHDNEEEKVKAIENAEYENFSIDGGSTYTYSTHKESSEGKGSIWTYHGGFVGNWTIGKLWSTAVVFGTNFTLTTENGRAESTETMDTTGDYQEWDYYIEDGNRDTDISINKYAGGLDDEGYNHSDIFTIFGGQTYNPYEGQEVTKYYKPGTPLGNGTVQMEQPSMSISVNGQNPAKSVTVTDIPSGQEMNLTLHCTNMANAHQGLDFSYDLVVLEPTNGNGLQILMDGVPINGRSLRLPQSETVTKQITIRQTDQSILNYEGVVLRFCSQYQAGLIKDDVTINAYFTPSSSPIELMADETVLNLETLERNDSNVVLKMMNFNRQFKNLRYVGLQYRYEDNTQWNTIHTYVTNIADSLNESYSFLPHTSTLRYAYNMMNDNMFPQGTYTFRAFTTTPYGSNPNDAATVYSNEVQVVKDNVRPSNLTTPTPTNGILRYGDDLSIEFNEDIVPGYVNDKNIIVTAKLNDQPIQHDVAIYLRPYGDQQSTVNPIFLNGDFSIDCWMKWFYPGTILHLGSRHFELGIDDEGHIFVSIGGAQVVSKNVIPKDKWTYLVLSYKSADRQLTALAQYDTVTLPLFTDEDVDDLLQLVHYSDDNYLYLGDMDGAMHDLSLFKIYRNVHEAAATKYQEKDNYVYGLTNYWPMKEGHGHTAGDTRHTHDFYVNDSWLRDNKNYSLRLDDENGVSADISQINTGVGDSYAIEMWVGISLFSDSTERTIFETGTNPSNRLGLYLNTQKDWILRYGNQEQTVVNHEDFTSLTLWNHVALNVVRGQSASFYFNGNRTAVIAEHDVPPMEGASLIIGRGLGSLSVIDEVRIWHATLSESRLLNNMYNCIDTTDVYSRGLVAYYPFEKAGTENGVSTMVETLENMAPHNSQSLLLSTLGDYWLTTSTPPLKNAPVESRIIAKPVVSDRKVVINLQKGNGISARDIEGTTLNITVDKVHDIHGNQSNPIRWTTYVQCNTLKWTKDSVNVIKKYGDDYTFDVNIENRGGSTEYYTLYNMPQWLTLVDSERTDDLAPLKTKTLRFRVNPLVAVGNYDVTIGLQGNLEIQEPLRIVMKVSGERPAWSVDPTAYENQMNIIGQVYINGILMENSESCVAAFIDDECRGIASPEQVRGSAYVTMTVYGTGTAANDLNKPITFRIWDASRGVAYTDVTTSNPDGTANNTPDTDNGKSSTFNITFMPDQLIGDFDHPIVWTKGNNIEQQLHITPKWYWLALGVEPADKRPIAVFPALTSWQTIIKSKTSSVVYSNGVEWRGTLQVEPATMYKMMLQRLETSKDLPDPLPVTGRQLDLKNTPITLEHEWNWMAYTPLTTMTVNEALAGANPQQGDRIKSQTAIAIYNGYQWEGSLKALESGHGYMYYSNATAPKQFVYPAATAAARAYYFENDDSKLTTQKSSLFNPIDGHEYPDNMSMVIELRKSGQVLDTCEVAAYIGGECRGATRADDGLYYLIIAGEGSGQQVDIVTCIDGEIMTIDQSVVYTTDQNIGTPWEPYIITIDNITTNINNHEFGTRNSELIYDLQGRRVDNTQFETQKSKLQKGVYIQGRRKVVK